MANDLVDEGLAPWESQALGRLRSLLANAEINHESGTVVLVSGGLDPRGEGEPHPWTFHDIDELRDILRQEGDEAMIESMPWERGPVFDTDSEHLVDIALDDTDIPRFFASVVPDDAELLIDFDDLCKPEHARQIQLTLEEVNDLLIEALAQNPDLLHTVHPRRFEELVAELFKRMGCEVTLTPASKDGGRDVLAVRRDDIGTILTLVECKKFRPDRKVGVALVRSLYGVVTSDRASHGVLATTSSFTRTARAFEQKLQYHLTLRDFDDLVEWCRRYRRTG